MRKKLIAAILSVTMVFNTSAVAFAEGSADSAVEVVEELNVVSELVGDSVVEVEEAPKEKESNTEVAAQPAEEAEKPEAPEQKSEETVQVTETTDNSGNSEQPAETAEKSEPSEQPAEIVDNSENSEQPTETVDNSENSEQPTETADNSGNSEQPTETVDNSDNSGQNTETVDNSENSEQPTETTENVTESATSDAVINDTATQYAVVLTIESGNSTIEYYTPGDVVTLTTPSIEHYTFKWWEVECEESVTIRNNSFVMPAARVDISAQWEPEEYSISIYYLSDTGRRLRTSDYANVTYGYEFALDSNYVFPTVEGFTAYKIVRNSTGEESNDVSEYRNFIKISNVEKDEIFYVYYKPSDVDFVVNHYLQNLDGSYSDAVDSETYTSTYGSTVSNASYVGEYTGFTWNGVTESIELATNSNVISVYYSRNSYYLYHQVGEEDTDAMECLYDETVTIADLGTPIRAGYTFTGWQTGDGTAVTESTIQMPAHDLYLVPVWEAANVYYTIRYWVESVDSANEWTANFANTGSEASGYTPTYDFVSDKVMQAPTGTVITDQAMLDSNRDASINSAGYTFERFDEVTVGADGSSVVNVYYRRNTFSFQFQVSRNNRWRNHTWTASGLNFNGYLYYKYGANLTGFWPETTVRWQTSQGTGYLPPASATDGKNVVLYQNNNATNRFYIKANLQKEDGTYDESVSAYVDYETYITTGNNSTWILDYNSMPAGYDFDVVWTSNGWVTPSGVGDRFSAYKLSGGSNNTVYIKLKRIGYQISFSNSEEIVGVKSNILFDSSISNMLDGITITKPTGHEDFIFIGFKDENDKMYEGNTPDTAYAEFASSVNGKMPSHNVSLTAVWQAPEYTVNFYYDESKEELLSSETVEYGKTVSQVPENPTREGYNFISWCYLDGTTEKIYWADKVIYSNLDIYPKWIRSEDVIFADILVKHNYYDGDGNYIQTDEETEQGVVGTVVTINAREDEGYFPDVYIQNISVEESGNVVEFNYKQMGEVEYTVRYVDADGNSLLPDVTKTS